jgi:hypothetical protein
MIDYYDLLENQIVASCSSSGAALVAGIADSLWASYHIFRGTGGELIKGVNRGRLPVVYVKRDISNYTQESMSDSVGGYVESTWKVTLIAGTTSRTSEYPSEKMLHLLANTILSDLRKKWDFRQGSEEIGVIEVLPFGFMLNITVRVTNTYDQTAR